MTPDRTRNQSEHPVSCASQGLLLLGSAGSATAVGHAAAWSAGSAGSAAAASAAGNAFW